MHVPDAAVRALIRAVHSPAGAITRTDAVRAKQSDLGTLDAFAVRIDTREGVAKDDGLPLNRQLTPAKVAKPGVYSAKACAQP
jgi:hypothetical protein